MSRLPPPLPRGLHLAAPGAAPGYVLYSPLSSGTTYLLDREARVVHTWESEYSPHSLYLLEDGSLLRPGRFPEPRYFMVGGRMGIVQRFSWEGELLWEWQLASSKRILHHDIEPLPNGNFLAIGWEARSPDEALAVGRRPELIPENGLWPEFLVEIEPIPPDDARIVWEWHVWDHLVQDVDPGLPDYGDPAEHPHRIDINAGGPPRRIDTEELKELRALGYVPDTPADAPPQKEWKRLDYLHINAVDWNPRLDQIVLTVPDLNEIWVLERPQSTEEAAGPAGDLVYRWGNPANYGRGRREDRQLFFPHDARWIPEGWEWGGRLMVFNNGAGRPDGRFSSVEVLEPPIATAGSDTPPDTPPYALPAEGAWGPAAPVWRYTAPEPTSFYAGFMSGAHPLPNGNTFVTHGPRGRMFEVTREGETVWDFHNPWGGEAAEGGGRRLRYGVFRAEKISPDHPGLAGRDLTPLPVQPPPETEVVDSAKTEPDG